MISERTFAERYTSFWHQCLPMGEEVTDSINKHAEAMGDALRASDEEVREDLVSELGLRWFGARVAEGRLSSREPRKADLQKIESEVTAFIGRLRGSPTPELPPPSAAETDAAKGMAEMLVTFVRTWEYEQAIVARPPFVGCGLLAACRGDLLVGHTLYEVKAVEKGFRQPHIRQLVTYCALNFASPAYDIRRIGLINPRKGIYFRSDLEWIVQLLSGQESAGLFHEILDFVSTERISA